MTLRRLTSRGRNVFVWLGMNNASHKSYRKVTFSAYGKSDWLVRTWNRSHALRTVQVDAGLDKT